MGELFYLIDCYDFYVSCERVFRPDLEGGPVIVLSNNYGCAIGRSNDYVESVPDVKFFLTVRVCKVLLKAPSLLSTSSWIGRTD